MIKIKVLKPFSYAYDGIKLVHYAPGEHKVLKECADVAIQEGWAKKVTTRKTRKAKVKKAKK